MRNIPNISLVVILLLSIACFCPASSDINLDCNVDISDLNIMAEQWLSTRIDTLDDGLMGYWNFDEGQGSVAYDLSGGGHDASIYGAVFTDDGISGSALSFDGVNDYVNTFLDVSWSDQLSSTISLWINPQSSTEFQGLLGKGAAGGYGSMNWEWGITQDDNTSFVFQYFDIYGRGEITSVVPITSLNQWHNFIITYNASSHQARFYLNGEFIESITNADPLQDRTTPMLIGHAYRTQGNNYYYNGLIDEVRVYNRPISESEARSLYLQPSGTGKQVADLNDDTKVNILDLGILAIQWLSIPNACQ